MNPSENVLLRISDTMRSVFSIPPGYVVQRETTSADVAGWDSLSHAILIMKVEEEFGIDLPLDKIYALDNVGELADLIGAQMGTTTK